MRRRTIEEYTRYEAYLLTIRQRRMNPLLFYEEKSVNSSLEWGNASKENLRLAIHEIK